MQGVGSTDRALVHIKIPRAVILKPGAVHILRYGAQLLGLGLALRHGRQTKRLGVRDILDARPLGVEQHFLGKCRAVSNDAFRHAHGQVRDGNNQGDHDDDKKDNPLTDAEISEHVLIS